MVTLSAGGTNSSTLTFASRSDTLPGKLVIRVNAGGPSRYAMITVLVSSPSSSSILGLPPVDFYLALGASIAALAVAVSLVIVRTRRTKGPPAGDR